MSDAAVSTSAPQTSPNAEHALPDAASWTVTWETTADAIAPEFWARCFPPPNEGLWWYRAFETADLQDQFTFFYGAIRRDGELAGIAPAFAMNLGLEIVLPDEIAPLALWIGRTFPSLRYQRTLFIGSPCAEEGHIGLIPGVALADVLPALNAAVEAKAAELKSHMIVWKDVPEAAAQAFDVIQKQAKLFRVPSFPGAEIHKLPGSLEGYLKLLSSPRRYKIKKKLKDSRSVLDIETTVIQHPTAAEMAEIWALFWQTYEKATTRFEKLNPAFFEGLCKPDTTHILMLRRRSDGKLVAFMLCYYEGCCATNKFIGIDYALGDKTYLYFRLFEEFIVWATSMGATWCRSGQTGYQAKLELGHTLVPLYNFARNRNGVMNWISAQVGKSITWSSLDPDLKLYVAAEQRRAKETAEASKPAPKKA